MSRGRLWKGVVDWLWSRRQVGEDAYHRYYAEYVGKGVAERRYVEYKDGNHVHASDRMDTEWWSWLHNRRSLPPTEEELLIKRQQQHVLAQRVQAIELEEERRRLRSLHNRNRQDHHTPTPSPGEPPANAAERDVRRRQRTLLRLQQAASPQQNDLMENREDRSGSPAYESSTRDDTLDSGAQFPPASQSGKMRSSPPASRDATADDRNIKEEATVSLATCDCVVEFWVGPKLFFCRALCLIHVREKLTVELFMKFHTLLRNREVGTTFSQDPGSPHRLLADGNVDSNMISVEPITIWIHCNCWI